MSDLIIENKLNEFVTKLPPAKNSEDLYKKTIEKWRILLSKLDSFQLKAENIPIHAYLKYWVGHGIDSKNNKAEMVEALKKDPETAMEIQDLAQTKLKTEIGDSVILYRGVKGSLDKGAIKISGWDSLTSNKDFASVCANPHTDWGWKEGLLLQFEVPVENIFTFYKAHPAFNPHLPEEEFILNENGIKGAKLVAIDNIPPTSDEIVKLKESMPDLEAK